MTILSIIQIRTIIITAVIPLKSACDTQSKKKQPCDPQRKKVSQIQQNITYFLDIFWHFLSKINKNTWIYKKLDKKQAKKAKFNPAILRVKACDPQRKYAVTLSVNTCDTQSKKTPLKPLLLLDFLPSLTNVINTIVISTIVITPYFQRKNTQCLT